MDFPSVCKGVDGLTNQFIHIGASNVLRTTPVQEQIFEQASNTLHHINRTKIFTEISAMARLWDIFRGWGPADSKICSSALGPLRALYLPSIGPSVSMASSVE